MGRRFKLKTQCFRWGGRVRRRGFFLKFKLKFFFERVLSVDKSGKKKSGFLNNLFIFKKLFFLKPKTLKTLRLKTFFKK